MTRPEQEMRRVIAHLEGVQAAAFDARDDETLQSAILIADCLRWACGDHTPGGFEVMVDGFDAVDLGAGDCWLAAMARHSQAN